MGRIKDRYFVWQVSERGEALAITCMKCGRNNRVTASIFAPHIQELPVHCMPFRCSICESREVKVVPDIFNQQTAARAMEPV